jgi:hypothetical protein
MAIAAANFSHARPKEIREGIRCLGATMKIQLVRYSGARAWLKSPDRAFRLDGMH